MVLEEAMLVFMGLFILVGTPALMIAATGCCVALTFSTWADDLKERREQKVTTLAIVRLVNGRPEALGPVWVNPISWSGLYMGVLTLMIGFLSFGLSWMMLPHVPEIVGL